MRTLASLDCFCFCRCEASNPCECIKDDPEVYIPCHYCMLFLNKKVQSLFEIERYSYMDFETVTAAAFRQSMKEHCHKELLLLSKHRISHQFEKFARKYAEESVPLTDLSLIPIGNSGIQAPACPWKHTKTKKRKSDDKTTKTSKRIRSKLAHKARNQVGTT